MKINTKRLRSDFRVLGSSLINSYVKIKISDNVLIRKHTRILADISSEFSDILIKVNLGVGYSID